MPQTISNIPLDIESTADAHDPTIQKYFLKTKELENQAQWKQIVAVESGVTDLNLKDSSISGINKAARKVENASAIKQVPIENFDQTYTQEEFQVMMPFTKKAWQFGIKKRNIERITTELRMACVRRQEELVADRLNNGWSTTYSDSDDSGAETITISGGNGVAMFSASQTREDAGPNWTNIITDIDATPNPIFDYSPLKGARKTASAILSPVGEKFRVNYDTLVCKKDSSVHSRAEEILASKGLPGSADNDGRANVMFKIIALDYLDNDTYWFMMDSSMINYDFGLQVKISEEINMKGPDIVFESDEIRYKSGFQWALGHNDPRGWAGSNATETA